MTRPRDPRPAPEALLPPLDDEPGPMPQLSAAEADAIARGAVSRWAARPPGLEPADDGVGPSQPLTPQAAERLAQSALRLHARKQLLPRSTLRAATVALSLSGAVGVSFAAYWLWPAVSERGPHASADRETRSDRETGIERETDADRETGTDRRPHASSGRDTSTARETSAQRPAEATPRGSIELQLKAADTEPSLEPRAATPGTKAKLQPKAPDTEPSFELRAATPGAAAKLQLKATDTEPRSVTPEGAAKLPPQPEFSEVEPPEELLARANALRAKRRWVAAESTYRQVATAHASDQQRYVALVAAAAIALQHLDKPGRALNLYQSALTLAPHGNLSEETLYGIAECYRALKNPTAELKALERLSREHPAGMLSESAQRRVATLTADLAAPP